MRTWLIWLVLTGHALSQEAALDRWLQAPQAWERDTDGPVLSLGEAGRFDDTHLLSPVVAHESGEFQLWYGGSSKKVANRVFNMGLAASPDGRVFTRKSPDPVFTFGDGKHSILTPSLLRNGDGTVLRENGKLRLWFSSTWFEGGNGLHTLHESASTDGVTWDAPSAAQLENLYAPTVLKIGDAYRMWFVDVTKDPWFLRHAASADGKKWDVTQEPVMVIDQPWEKGRLFYPHVLFMDGVYLMWYGSYWRDTPNTTAIGFAVSPDGLKWTKHAQNPVFRPDPNRSWESNYTTSHGLIRLPDGSLRIWYASRKAPPFVNKYFALNTAVWKSPPKP